MINERLAGLADYPFQRLNALLAGLTPPAGLTPLDLGIGDPQHAAPPIIAETLARNAHLWNRYPPLLGTDEFRQAAAEWLVRRYRMPAGLIDAAKAILPVSGTREALFLAATLTVPQRKAGQLPAVALPNPFYAVYLGAGIMAGAEPVLLPATTATGFLPDLDALQPALLDRLALLYLASPGNPQGAIASRAYLTRAVGLARKHGFVLAMDECYSEIYDRAAPTGVLEVADGRLDNLLVFHSCSKRSSAAGLRAGFVVGDPALIAAFWRLRTFGGAGMPLPIQAAAAALYRDEVHAVANRECYQQKFDIAERALGDRPGFRRPDGGFFLWLPVDDGEAAARALWQQAALRVLPGAYLAQDAGDGTGNPGRGHIRMALVHDEPLVADALGRAARVLKRANTAEAA